MAVKFWRDGVRVDVSVCQRNPLWAPSP